MQSILEYLKRRDKQQYSFPEDLNDETAIINWLENNRFKKYSIDTNLFRVGKPSYRIGPMDHNPNSHWIEISDGVSFLVIIRTVDNFKGNLMRKISYYDGSTLDFTEIDKTKLFQYIEKILNK